jgi:hypothetical protein
VPGRQCLKIPETGFLDRTLVRQGQACEPSLQAIARRRGGAGRGLHMRRGHRSLESGALRRRFTCPGRSSARAYQIPRVSLPRRRVCTRTCFSLFTSLWGIGIGSPAAPASIAYGIGKVRESARQQRRRCSYCHRLWAWVACRLPVLLPDTR